MSSLSHKVWISATLVVAVYSTPSRASEAELVQLFLQSPAVSDQITAVNSAAKAQRRGAPLFENPQAQVRHEEAKGPAGATTNAMGASWSFDLGFAAVSKNKAASARKDASPQYLQLAKVAVVCEARRMALDTWNAEQSVSTVDQAQQRLQFLLDTLKERVTAGEASGHDLAHAQIALVAHQRTLETEQAQAAQQFAQLQAWGLPAFPELELLPLPTSRPQWELALEQQPELIALEQEERAAQNELAAEKQSAVPDLELFAGTRWDSNPGEDTFTQGVELTAGVELPFFDWNRKAIAEQQHASDEVKAYSSRRRAEIHTQLEGAVRRIDALSESIDLPDLDALWSSTLTQFRGGEASISDLLETAEDVETAQLSNIEHARQLREAWLDFECTSGSFHDPSLQSMLE